MCAYSKSWDEDKPANTRNISLGDDDIREFKYAIRERLAKDHQFAADETGDSYIGWHKQVSLIEAADIGTGAEGYPILGAQTVVAPELVYTDEADNDVQITDAGYIDGDSIAFTTDFDAGAIEVKAETFESDVATGTAPLTVASTTKVDNLNSDLLDGYNTSTTAVASKVPVTDADGLLTTFVTKAAIGIDSGKDAAVGAVSFNFTFASAPVVVIGLASAPSGDNYKFYPTSVGTTGFTITAYAGITANHNWIAIGTPA